MPGDKNRLCNQCKQPLIVLVSARWCAGTPAGLRSELWEAITAGN